MDKNSLILDIKNDLNSIKKQVEVTLAKLTVLESMIELDNKLGVSVAEPVEAPVEELGVRSEELGVKEPNQESRDNACIVREPEPEPIVESIETLITESEPVAEPVAVPVAEPVEAPGEELGVRSEELGVKEPKQECRDNACIVREQEPESEIELKEEITPNSEAQVLRNLMSVISLGDKFRFRHDLFSDDNDLFKETIEILNTLEDFTKAVDFLDEKFGWDPEDATVVYFYDIIKPKF